MSYLFQIPEGASAVTTIDDLPEEDYGYIHLYISGPEDMIPPSTVYVKAEEVTPSVEKYTVCLAENGDYIHINFAKSVKKLKMTVSNVKTMYVSEPDGAQVRYKWAC